MAGSGEYNVGEAFLDGTSLDRENVSSEPVSTHNNMQFIEKKV